MDGSILFSTTQSVGNYLESSFTVQNKIYKHFGTLCNFLLLKKMNFMNFKKKAKWIGYLGVILDTRLILLQNEPSPILVPPKLGEEIDFECWKRHFSGERL